jgi:hypothetical protein
MRPLKLAIAVLLFFGSLLFCVGLARIVPVDHWGFAISINFLFMAYFTLLFGKLFIPAYSSGYFTPRPFERNGSVYRWLGVTYYVVLLRLIGWEKLLRKDQPIKNSLESLKVFEATTRGSEVIHVCAAISVAAFTIWVAWRYSVGHIHWLVLLNILVNVYPVLLQRYNRPRVNRLIRLKETLMPKHA